MEEYIKGSYSRSIFSGNNGYTVGLFKLKDTNVEELEDYVGSTITFTGYFDNLNTSDAYKFYGKVVNHQKYGIQFEVSSYEVIKPSDKLGIITFLSSDLFPGIGEALAKKIVDVLGDNALDIILDNPTVLDGIPKLSKKKINTIITNLVKYDESHKIILYLTDVGFNMKEALDIYNLYKTYSIETVSNDIYSILDNINISFSKLDSIALKIGYKNDDSKRIMATIIYCMKNVCFNNGDTYLTKMDILMSITNYLKMEISNLDEYLNKLANTEKIYIDNDKYYLKDIWDDSEYIINKLKYLSSIPTDNKNIKKEIDTYSKNKKITYNEEQILAIEKAILSNLVIITGGPGVGKTTIIKAITDLYTKIYKRNKSDIVLLAPTGRGAKRMSEDNLSASTIHRFLKWNKDDNSFNVNEFNKDMHDMIIVDEVSMVDISLFASLLKGIKDDVKLVLVGDYNQLPSVGPGNILKDLIDSEVIETVYLEKLYRQSPNSYIPTLASDIKNNCVSDFVKTLDDYTFLKCESDSIVKNLQNIINKIKDKDIQDKVMVMAPMYKGDVGIDNLNKILQNIINPNGESFEYGDTLYRVGDKILELVNMPDDNVFNGDIGYVTRIDKEKNTIYVSFDGNIVKYTKALMPNITLGYVISIHKSQGSEFDTVILPMTKKYSRMLYKKLIYTAVTRAKRKLIILGEDNAFLYACQNNREEIRKTDLKDKLINMYK